MSGFESAIRGAISRAPDGRPETRERIYTAARASLERTLSRVGGADDESRRAALERTIERIEAEWVARSARALGSGRPVAPAAPPSSAPARPVEPEPHAAGNAAEAIVPTPPAPTAPAPPSTEPPPRSDANAAATSPHPVEAAPDRLPSPSLDDDPPVGDQRVAAPREVPPTPAAPIVPDMARGEGAPVANQGPSQTGVPVADRSVASRETADGSTAPAPAAPTPPAMPSAAPSTASSDAGQAGPEPVRPAAIDPVLAAELAARDGLAQVAPPLSVEPRAGALEGNAVPAVDEPTLVADRAAPKVPPAMPETTAPAVEVDRPVGAPAPKKAPARVSRRQQKAERKASRRTEKRKAASDRRPRRGRNIARALSLLLLVGVAVLGYRWLGDSGMLDAVERATSPITVVERPPEVEADERPWTELMTREIAGAIEPLPGEEALRVNGRAEVGLDAAALAALGSEISVSLRVRAVGEPGEAAVSCEFPGGGCGRVRFPLPREAEERVVAATIGEGGEARLVLDAGIGGSTAPFDLLGVTARAR